MTPNKNDHVFIVGIPRTGTSIVYRTIQKLPNFRMGKFNLWETAIFRDNVSFSGPDLYYPGLLGYLPGEKDSYDKFLQSVKTYTDTLQGRRNKHYRIAAPPSGNPLRRLFSTAWNNLTRIRWNRSAKSEIIKTFFSYARQCRRVERIVEKTPHHYRHVHQILWTFPHARILWMVRHPVDIITSSIKRAKIDKNYKNYWNVHNFVTEYRNSFRLFDFYKKRFKNRITLVKYEDFVGNPAGEMGRICAFLDETYSEDALVVAEHEKFKWKPDPHLSADIVKKTERKWQDHLSLEDAGKIEAGLQDLMKKYNFANYVDSAK
ncbi:MAG: sulfotransferase [Candidatus Aminicenantes bacterium]|nr:sulfotransferase [Candidatus Aminicenantes bacterium]